MTHADKVHAAAEEGRRTVEAIAADMEGDFSGRNRAYVRRQAQRLREAVKAIDDEGALLSAGVCPHLVGNEHGNGVCAKTGELI